MSEEDTCPMCGSVCGSVSLDEEDRLRAENERLRAVIDQMHRALDPFAQKWLYPDDTGVADMLRADEDWDEAENEERFEDMFIKRAWIRAAREARTAALALEVSDGEARAEGRAEEVDRQRGEGAEGGE